jgi:KDO2-lipid IV(A) lauroyltransferase
LARFVPVRFGYFLAECTGDVLFLLSARYRKVVSSNIKRVTGLEQDGRTLRWKVRSVFKNVTKNYFDLTRLSRLRLENLKENVTIEGWHHLAETVTNSRGAIIATAHLGSFDHTAQVLALHGIEMTIFVEAFHSTPFLRNIAKLRQRNGGRILPVSISALRDGLKILRRGGTMAIVCDRDIQRNGLRVNFFREETSLPYGAISLALRTGAAIVPVFSVRKPGNRYAIYIEPPLELVDIRNRNQSVKANLEKFVSIMEKYIRQYPEQWAVLEPVWGNQ